MTSNVEVNAQIAALGGLFDARASAHGWKKAARLKAQMEFIVGAAAMAKILGNSALHDALVLRAMFCTALGHDAFDIEPKGAAK